jgi:hypothetical protein
MHVNMRLRRQESQIVGQLRDVLATRNAAGHGVVERLNADFELNRALRKCRDEFAQSLRKTVRNHLEVQEQAGSHSFEEEAKNRRCHAEIQIEGAIDELERSGSSVEESLHRREKALDVERPHRNLERRQAELAFEGAPARRFHIDDPLRDVRVRVEVVGQRDLGQIRNGRFDHPRRRRSAFEDLTHKSGKREVRFPGHDVVGESGDRLAIDLVTDLRPPTTTTMSGRRLLRMPTISVVGTTFQI